MVEAFNLKSAIEYMMKNMEAAKDCTSACRGHTAHELPDIIAQDALDDMPPRDESELDAVTLHNQAAFWGLDVMRVSY